MELVKVNPTYFKFIISWQLSLRSCPNLLGNTIEVSFGLSIHPCSMLFLEALAYILKCNCKIIEFMTAYAIFKALGGKKWQMFQKLLRKYSISYKKLCAETFKLARETNPRESDQWEIFRGTRDLDSAFYRVFHSTSALTVVVRTPGTYQSLTFLRNKYINQRQMFLLRLNIFE